MPPEIAPTLTTEYVDDLHDRIDELISHHRTLAAATKQAFLKSESVDRKLENLVRDSEQAATWRSAIDSAITLISRSQAAVLEQIDQQQSALKRQAALIQAIADRVLSSK